MTPRVSDEYKEQQRERIRQAAFACLRRQGFGNTSMTDVIVESGLSAGAIYRYYKSKEELVVDVARTVLGGRVQALAELRDREPPAPPSVAFPLLVQGLPDEFTQGGLLQVWGEAVANPSIRELVGGAIASIEEGAHRYWQTWWRSAGHDDATAATAATTLMPTTVALAQGYIFVRSLRGDDAARRHLDSMAAVLRLLETGAPTTPTNHPEGTHHA